MFENVGGSLKGWAKVTCYVGIALSVILGFLVMLGGSVSMMGLQASGGFFAGLVVMAVGSLGAWLGSLVLYAFGQMVEDASVSRACLEQLCSKQASQGGEAAAEDAPAKSTYVPSNSRMSLSGATRADGWTCRKCGAENSRESRFCKECGEYR